MNLRRLCLCLLTCLWSAESLQACSIPVFRYALERWPADLFEVSVFFDADLDAADLKRLDQLEDLAIHNGGNVNLEVVRCDLRTKIPSDLLSLWRSLPNSSTPHVIVRTPRDSAGQRIVWHGRLADAFLTDFASSPARHQIVQRLLQGDAVVWLMLQGTDQDSAQRTRKTLNDTLKRLELELQLPAGIGQPGSEVHAKPPLHLKFSTIEIRADDPAEQALVKLLHGRMKATPTTSESCLAPVFGRGRVLDVLAAKETDADTISELTQYLCGACSCQVKQQNPGFDLPLALNWEERLFDDGSEIPLAESTETGASSRDAEPTLVPIARGSSESSNSTPVASVPTAAVSPQKLLLVIGVFVALLLIAALPRP